MKKILYPGKENYAVPPCRRTDWRVGGIFEIEIYK